MRLTKGQLKRIIREEYSRLKRRGLIRETVTGKERAGIGTKAENAVRRYLNMPEVIRHASSHAPSDVMDARSGGFGSIEVKSASDGNISVELFDYADIKTRDIEELRGQIQAMAGDLVGICEDAADDYYAGFDNLIAVVGQDLYLVPREALRLMPSAVYGYGYRKKDKTIRPAAKFKIDMSKAVSLGTIQDAMAGTPMLESRYRRINRRRTRGY